MKKIIVLFSILCIALSTIAAPWDIKVSHKKSFEIPGVMVVPCTYIPGSPNQLGIRVLVDGTTGNYWAKAVVRIYCNYWHPQFPSGYYAWGYKTWEAEVSPYSSWDDTFWGLNTETFHTYYLDGALAIDDNDVTLISWAQE